MDRIGLDVGLDSWLPYGALILSDTPFACLELSIILIYIINMDYVIQKRTNFLIGCWMSKSSIVEDDKGYGSHMIHPFSGVTWFLEQLLERRAGDYVAGANATLDY
jgi:hypothetical protein